jgi:hypothetical protein
MNAAETPTMMAAGDKSYEEVRDAWRAALSAGIAAVLICGPVSALAEPVADFYKAKQIRFVIRTPPGGDYDLYSRILARFMGKHIPGNPSLIPANMPGSGGITAAKKRVTTIGTTSAGSASVQYPDFYNNVLGTRFKIVFGYAGGQLIDLAMEQVRSKGGGQIPIRATWRPRRPGFRRS